MSVIFDMLHIATLILNILLTVYLYCSFFYQHRMLHNILVWMIFIGCCSVLGSAASDKAQHVITVDRLGFDKSECCVHGNCPCSDLAFALENVENDTEIKILSDISLYQVVETKNASNIIIMHGTNVKKLYFPTSLMRKPSTANLITQVILHLQLQHTAMELIIDQCSLKALFFPTVVV